MCHSVAEKAHTEFNFGGPRGTSEAPEADAQGHKVTCCWNGHRRAVQFVSRGLRHLCPKIFLQRRKTAHLTQT